MGGHLAWLFLPIQNIFAPALQASFQGQLIDDRPHILAERPAIHAENPFLYRSVPALLGVDDVMLSLALPSPRIAVIRKPNQDLNRKRFCILAGLDLISGGEWFEDTKIIGGAGVRVCPGGFIVVERHQNVMYRIRWLVSVASTRL